jgi:serine/threonine-protein kinase
MSPEQASGTQELDARTDIYALACVLYEMLAGDPPFTGPTGQAVIARQLVDPVPSLRTLRPTVAEELQRAIEKALAKVPADRYETAGEFIEAAGAAAQVQVLPTKERRALERVQRRRLTPSAWRAGAAAAAALIVIAVVLFRMTASRPISITTSNILRVTSDPGLEFQPAISPDGSEVAYVVGPIGNPRIVVRSAIDVGLGESRPGQEVSGLHWLPAWTPDGASLRFVACAVGIPWTNARCDWKEVGKLGGPVRNIGVPRVANHYAWSWDGTRVAFPVRDSLFAYSAESGEPQLLGVHGRSWPLHSLAWSPDGRLIAYVNGNVLWRTSANVMGVSIWILDASGGQPVRVTDNEHLNVSPQWLPDSRHLLFVSNRDGPRGIYVVEVGPEGPRGPPRAVLSSSDPHSISVSADGSRLAYSKFTVAQNIWSVPIPRSGSVSIGDAVQVTRGNQVIEHHRLSPDGEWIVFDSDIRGEFGIYKQRLTGGQPQLVADITGAYPDWSPDGTEIVLQSGTGSDEVLVVSADGGAPEQLTDFPGFEGNPDWSPDGLAIAFNSTGPQHEGRWDLWIVSRDAVGMPWSDPVQLTDFGCPWPDWAPDGASMVCNAEEEGAGRWARVSRDGEVLSRYNARRAGIRGFPAPRFSADGSRIYFTANHEDGSRGVWWIPTEGGDPTKVVAFDDPSLTVPGFFSVGPENIYLTIAEYESDIWVMDLEW